MPQSRLRKDISALLGAGSSLRTRRHDPFKLVSDNATHVVTWYVGNSHDMGRNEQGRKRSGAMRTQSLHIEIRVACHQCPHFVDAGNVGTTERGGMDHARVRQQNGLDGFWIDLVAADIDDCFFTSGND